MKRLAALSLALLLGAACTPPSLASPPSEPAPRPAPKAPAETNSATETVTPPVYGPPTPISAWGDADRGLQCRLVPLPADDRVLLRVELRYRGPVAEHDDLARHLLLTRHVDRNHLLRFTVSRNGSALSYVGPRPPGDIGDVEDVVLTDAGTWSRDVDMTDLFAWESSGSHEVAMEFDGWTYETALPSYWTGSIRCRTRVHVPAGSPR